MKLRLLICACALVLLNISSSEAGQKRKTKAENDAAKNGRPKTTFKDLYDDVLYLIFIELDLSEWSNMIELSNAYVSVAKDAYRNKYHGHEVRIYGTDVDGDANKPKHRKQFDNNVDDQYNQKWLILNDYKMVLNVFKFFSNSIKELDITEGVSVSIDRNRLKVVNQYVNHYATDYVNQLEFVIRDDTLEQFTNPFTNVEKLECLIGLEQIGDNILPLNELFPNLKKAEFEMMSTAAYNLIDCAFPELQVVRISLLHGSREDEQQALIEGFLQKNSQIKNLDIYHFSWEYVEMFSKYLTNLEYLRLNSHQFGENVITFESAKHVIIAGDHREYATQLLFPQLESFRFGYGRDSFDEWREFFSNHQTLKQLYIPAFASDYFVPLTEHLSNLVEVEFFAGRISVDRISAFIRNHTEIAKVKVMLTDRFFKVDDNLMNNLRGRIGDKFQITQQKTYNGLEVLFERSDGEALEE